METFFFIIHIIIIILLVTGVLMQESREEGLSGLGTAGSSESPFSKRSKGWSGLLDKAVRILAWAFLISCILSSMILPRLF